MKIKTKDQIVRQVLKKMDKRSLVGQEKYGSTMHDEVSTNKKDLRDFITDVQEELMDALLYLEASKACLQEEIEDCYLRDALGEIENEGMYDEDASDNRMSAIGQNGNTGLHYHFNNCGNCTVDEIDTAHYIYNKISDYPG